MKSTVKTIFPENIRCVAVTAPAGFPDQNKLANSIELLTKMVKVKSYIAAKSSGTPSYLSADSADRLAMFNAAVRDPEVDLILAVRGGFGSVHILSGIDYETLKKRNLPVMGYSDITSLHCAMLAKNAGIPIAGSNLLQLDEVLSDELSFTSHRQALRETSTPADIPQYWLAPVNLPAQSLTVKAPAYAANLTVLTSLCGTEFMPDFSNHILIIEDVNEPVYKIDRMLAQLCLSGVLRHIKALVFGKFTAPENSAEALHELFTVFAAKLPCPCFKNFEFGHEFPMCAVNAAHTIAISAEK
ncbi:MAG: LD-carboxypeptidase [Lentisphaeria bacterium]|nr:LD-carboxypeptidase [Lentisphaeria bacterium]